MNKNHAFSLEPNRVRQGALLVSVSDETSAGAEARYPRVHTPFPVLDEAYRLALRELDLLRTEDGCWDTGALWKGVWTRDISYSVVLSLGLLDPATARASLLKKTGPIGIIQDTGTGGSWPVSTDRMTWIPAAWEVYVATGDRAWLDQIFPFMERSLTADLATAFNAETGLFRGESSFLDWRAQSYPAWMEASDIYGSYCLGTNAVHARAWALAGRCARALGRDESFFTRVSTQVAEGIQRHLWDPAQGQLGGFLYGRHHALRSERVESLGSALCVLFDLVDDERGRAILEHLPLEPFGVPCFHPHIPGLPPYHNRGVWPFVVAYAGWAGAKAGHDEVVQHALACLVRAAVLFGTHKENMVAETGGAIGTCINSDRQLWSVAGMLGAVYRILFGLQAEPDHLAFRPCIPADWRGRYELKGFPWRGSTLDLVVEGSGHHVASFRLDGKTVADARLPADLTGAHRVEIRLEPADEASPAARYVQVEYAPATPQTRREGRLVRWGPVERAVRYRVLLNGQAVTETHDVAFPVPDDLPVLAELQVIAFDRDQRASFASAPLVLREEIVTAGPGEPAAVRLEPRPDSSLLIEFTVPADGLYAVAGRYANGQNDSEHDNKCAVRTLVVDGQPAGKLVMPQRGKGRWDDFGHTFPVRLPLTAGAHRAEIRYTETDRNMNGTVNEALFAGLCLTRLS